jgi:3-hydroxyisobutyrate dehydrogenase-like beta-hydroxyacid dehydrogenase
MTVSNNSASSDSAGSSSSANSEGITTAGNSGSEPGQVGIVGTGLLGSAIAETLIAAGYQVVGFDVQPNCRARLKQLGGEPADNADQVFARCRTVLLSLPDSHIVGQLLSEITSLSPGHLIIDTTTGSPGASEEIGRRLSENSVEYLDATVLGSSEQARRRDVVTMVGGTAVAFEQAEPILDCFSSRRFHVGPWGCGSRAKLIVNLVLGLNRAVLAEGLTLAAASGMDQSLMLEILRSGAAASRVMDTKGRKMIESDFDPPQARLDQHWKDVRLILELGRSVGLPLPLSELHNHLLSRASSLGFGALDNSAIIRAFSHDLPSENGRSTSDQQDRTA